MDRISLLPDDSLLQILSLLPSKDVLKTTVLSKRWRYLWKLVPKLEYIHINDNADHARFVRFVDRSLLLSMAPVLESLHFKLDRECSQVDVGFWVRTAVERGLRELNFEYSHMINEPIRLPQSLFTCGTLVVLKLKNVSLVDVQFPVCFQLLKTLHLVDVIFLDDESPQKLLSCCPVLEVLELDRAQNDNVTSFSLTVPSLQRFIYSAGYDCELVMNVPSLKYFKTLDQGYKCIIECLPEIVEAHVEVICSNTDDILRALASVKRLLLCLPTEPRFPTGSIFHQLEHLEFCTCETEWDVLTSMLQHSPKLRSLKLNEGFLSLCADKTSKIIRLKAWRALYMDRISLLPNDLLLQILSLLPTKDVLTTSVLSKRWRYLWQLVPKLEYIDIDESSDHVRFLLFVNMSLLLNTAPVLESLNFKLGRQCDDVDIGFWIKIAVERSLRELNFDYFYFNISKEPIRLNQSLYTCGTLVVLKLQNVSLVNVQFPVCFQFLKTLHLLKVIFLDNESPQKLFSSCPVLEVLLVDRNFGCHVNTYSVKVPSLQRLVYDGIGVNDTKLVINTPSLKYLKTSAYCDECMIDYMPELLEASVDVRCSNVDDILISLTSLKRLLLCLPPQSPFPTGRFFHQLVHLEFCTCETGWDLLMCVLQHSPKLRSLKLNQTHYTSRGVPTHHWDEPSSVPETLMFALETFEWRNYKGGKTERQLATFILKHSRRLKIATFSPQVRTCTKVRMKYRMIRM